MGQQQSRRRGYHQTLVNPNLERIVDPYPRKTYHRNPLERIDLEKPHVETRIDAETIAAFQRAKKMGEDFSNQFKLVTLGAEGAGKSSTIDTLLNETFDINKKSTVGAAVNTCTVDRHMTTGWKKIATIGIVLKNVSQQWKKEVKVGMRHASTSSDLLPLEQTPQAIIDKAKEVVESEEELVDSNPRMVVFDLGGQEVYYEIHGLFLAIEDIALLVFNASKDLDAKVISRERGKKFLEKIATREKQSNLKAIEMHLQSVYSRGQLAPPGMISVRVPVVIMVGAHAENLTLEEQQCIVNTICKRLHGKKLLEHLPTDLAKAFHFIGNSSPKPTAVKHLREVIIEAAEPIINVKRPISYLEFEQQIYNIGLKEVRRLQKTEAIEIAKQVGIKNEADVEAVLKYYMYKGVLLYYPEEELLKNEVFISPQEVADLVCTVVTTHNHLPPTAELQLSHDRYDRYGLLEEALFDYILSKADRSRDKDIILGLLKLFSLGAMVPPLIKFARETHISTEGRVLLFVPSLLIYNEKDIYHKKGGDIVIQYYFPENFLPESCFNQLLVKAIRWCNKQNYQIVDVCRNVGYFFFENGIFQQFTLQLHESTACINCYVTINPRQSPTEDQLVNLLKQRQDLLSYLETSITEVNKFFMPSAKTPVVNLECPFGHEEGCSPHLPINIKEPLELMICQCNKGRIAEIIPKAHYIQLFEPTHIPNQKKFETILRKSYAELTAVLFTTDLSPDFVSAGIISIQDEEIIRHTSTARDKAKIFLRIVAGHLEMNHTKSFTSMLDIMKRKGTESIAELARKIEADL